MFLIGTEGLQTAFVLFLLRSIAVMLNHVLLMKHRSIQALEGFPSLSAASVNCPSTQHFSLLLLRPIKIKESATDDVTVLLNAQAMNIHEALSE